MPFTLIGQHVVTLKRFYYHLLVCHALDIIRQSVYVVQTKIGSHKWQQVREMLGYRLPGKVAEGVVVDVRHQAERKRLLCVVQQDGVLRCHSEHHAVRQLEQVGQRMDGTICRGERGGNNQHM